MLITEEVTFRSELYGCLFAVLDDEDKTITAGSIVTVTVKLKRASMGDFLDSGKNVTQHSGDLMPLPEDAVEEVEKDADEEPQVGF